MDDMKYKIKKELDYLKKRISNYYNDNNRFCLTYEEENKKEKKQNIYRGHLIPIAYEFENQFALFLEKILGKKYNYYIDFSLNKSKPDIVITKKNNKDIENIVGIFELKANLGFCRPDKDKNKNDIDIRSIVEKLNEFIDNLQKNVVLKCSRSRIFFQKHKEKYSNKIINNQIEAIKQKYNNFIANKDDSRIKKYNNGSEEIKINLNCQEKIVSRIIVLTCGNISKEQLDLINGSEADEIIKKKVIFLYKNWYDNLEQDNECIDKIYELINEIEKK